MPFTTTGATVVVVVDARTVVTGVDVVGGAVEVIGSDVVLVVGAVGTGPSERASSPEQPVRTRRPVKAMSRCRRMRCAPSGSAADRAHLHPPA
jgi:hypothetical protein